ncbi:uncharacterized protein LOC105689624 isoform X1 [Athalia rosae]|uniref:uncharacterized protein LOC105689624 isoform X1 n=1 Tax=Athalia rosae TaxID=37344 RepID=UPI00203396D4|nr:uncharacterized protein LOC105689624 isoform X1 [Athalia rosae]
MGVVSSTFASLAIQLAWNCQRLLDPQYRCLQDGKLAVPESPTNVDSDRKIHVDDNRAANPRRLSADGRSPSMGNFREKSKGQRSTRRQRYGKRLAISFDSTLIANCRSDNPTSAVQVSSVVTLTPTPSPLRGPQSQFWDVTSSSGCSSDSGSYFDSDSEDDDVAPGQFNEPFVSKYDEDAEEDKEFAMSADEEAALRMTVGRGHFSRSKKDRFLNHLRLEKRLNILNNTFCNAANIERGRGKNNGRRYSGDLYRITY